MRWVNLGLLLGTLTIACGEDAPPIEPPPEVTQTAQNATEATSTVRDAGIDAEEAAAKATNEAPATKAEPTQAVPPDETKDDQADGDDDDDDDDDALKLSACLLRCKTDLSCARGCLED